MMHITNQFYNLGDEFYTKHTPRVTTKPTLLLKNIEVLKYFNIMLDDDELLGVCSGNTLIRNTPSYALVYAGHQFGSFNPRLGDGRALSLGNITSTDEVLYEMSLKGAGTTPYSRSGDGLLAIGPAIREYIVSEYFRALGISTTLSAVITISEDKVMREEPLRAAVLTRISKSFMRVGTFEYFLSMGNYGAITTLCDYAIRHYYQEVREGDYVALFEQICLRQATLISQWQSIGFIHGVMNTDNMSIVGETIDYGPCAFMDEFKHGKVFSFIDRGGRYAYENQMRIGVWNLTSLANCLIGIFDDKKSMVSEFERILAQTFSAYNKEYYERMGQKLGLPSELANVQEIVDELLMLLEKYSIDYTKFFTDITYTTDAIVALEYSQYDQLYTWLVQYKELRGANYSEAMKAVNPVFIPRNHLIEEIISAANVNNFEPLYSLVDALKTPFNEEYLTTKYTQPPHEEEKVTQTFCGT